MASTKKKNRLQCAAMRTQTAYRTLTASTTRAARDERGATMVEYGMLLAFALVVAFVVVMLFGNRVLGLFETADTQYGEHIDRATGTIP